MASEGFKQEDRIEYPYMPAGRSFKFTSENNEFMAQALDLIAKMESKNHPTAAVLVLDGKVIAKARNQADHKSFCPRTALGSPSGQEYEFCPNNCHPKNHSEPNAILNAKKAGFEDLSSSDMYLAGHWWACKSCWDSITSAGLKDVYLVEGAHQKYEGDGSKRKEIADKSGVFEGEISLAVLGPAGEEMSTALSRVGIEASPVDSATSILLLPGYEGKTSFSGKRIFDFREAKDWKNALTQLSVELEKN